MTDPQNVVLLTVDSWRADHCGFMGYDGDTTPALDEIAADGLVFENAIAPAPETNSSVSTILTGHYPMNELRSTGIDYTERIRHHMRTRQTLPGLFKEMGYTTAAFTTNPWTSRFFNFDTDFDFFEDFMDDNLSSDFIKDGRQSSVVGDLAVQMMNWAQGQDMFMSWEAFYDDLQAWIDDAPEPYFLWIFLVDIHMPYLPGKNYRSQSPLMTYPANLSLFAGKSNLRFESLFHDVLVRAYDDTIRYTDAFIDRLLSDVDGDSLVAIHADHGEAFGEDGVYGHGPLLSEEMIHVPFVVANGPRDRVSRPISLRRLPDLLPSLATTGEYLHATDDVVGARNYDPALAVRGETWKYVWRPESERLLDGRDGEWNEFDDPQLRETGRRLVAQWKESERERGRIHDAVDSMPIAPL
ncbi:sulfatase-like hydrolase/transferase [Haloprofundus halobius]|uniref:sulfatase-like hydrolase/transferase n=1 Tax=Haloprofundus halobius TaxID=2876194 RepID=UPI001CCA7B56|nr:sulfatase-like hydrolase/transferase [Haloprofundus halobius]